MQKFRSAIHRTNSSKCSGTVEIEDISLKFKNNTNSYHILAALEISIRSDSTGRLQMDSYKELSQERIELFIRNCITPGSTLMLPDSAPYRFELLPDFLCVFEPRQSDLAHTGKILSRFLKTCSSHTFVASADQRLSKQLNEFCFHHNNKLFPNPIAVFDNFIATILNHAPQQRYCRSASTQITRGVA